MVAASTSMKSHATLLNIDAARRGGEKWALLTLIERRAELSLGNIMKMTSLDQDLLVNATNKWKERQKYGSISFEQAKRNS